VRILGIIVAVIVGCVILVVGRSALVLGRHFSSPPVAIRAATDPARIAHGQHIAATTCAGCHGENLGGRLFVDGMPFMRLYASNLTGGRGGAARTFSDADFEGAIRHGHLPNGRSLLIMMPSEVFASVADDDLEDIIGALRAGTPVDSQMPAPAFGPVGRMLIGLGLAKLQSAPTIASLPSAPAKAPPVSASAEYGRYLSHIEGCTECHGAGLSGGLIPNMGPEKHIASNLTPDGLGAYNEATFMRALRQGVRPDGTPIDSFMPWRQFRTMTDTELGALYTYLRTVPARPFGNH
jgi:mono/diheme cytochrome c family protein